ncbi:MAG: NUDIX hydrolase [Ignavibacteria bacterium]|nr:NUDIX hydrolase [Ignavibacteria bacterium]
MPWEKIKSEYILNAKWLKVRKDTVKINDELVIDDYYVTENNDVVLVFPVIEKEYVILKKEYRYPLDKITQELPGGMFDGSKESALAAAKRELLEETGLSSESWINLGEFYDCPTKDTSKMHLFLANNCVQTAALLINPQEEIEPVKIGLNELEELINNNSIQVTGSMACIYKAMLYLKNSE